MDEQDDIDELLRSIEQELKQRRDFDVSWSSGSLAVLSIYLVRALLPDDPLLQKSPDELLNPPEDPEKTHTVKPLVRALQVIEPFKDECLLLRVGLLHHRDPSKVPAESSPERPP